MRNLKIAVICGDLLYFRFFEEIMAFYAPSGNVFVNFGLFSLFRNLLSQVPGYFVFSFRLFFEYYIIPL